MAAPILAPDQVEEAARLLREGGLVAFPTDTVYGVAAMADSTLHSAALQAFKGERREPFSVHLPDARAALEVAGSLRELERFAVTTLGPKGVTVIVAHGAAHAGIGLRIVQHEVGSKFLALAGAAVVATSANLHGQPPLNAPAQIAELPGIKAVLSAGELPERPASSVVRMLRSGVEVLREGAVSRGDLRKRLIRSIEFVCLGNLNRSAFAKGLLAAMQGYYARELAGFIPAYSPSSSGLMGNPKARSPGHMVAVARSFDVDLSSHVPARFDGARASDLRVAMGADIWQSVPDGHRWSVSDPMGGPIAGYEEMTQQVRAHFESLFARTAVVREADAALEDGFDKLFSAVQGDRP
ncbi:MAG: Sua5/YciO/YrdC/YwlC family protein [Planctomycetes bacterium]|nr:Sua5/YciO/YrdC/YwlC family protein [Planctomycetota bacterium]